MSERRAAEHAKYARAYGLNPDYRMGRSRMEDAVRDLSALRSRGSYLDVSCGRGEMLAHARRLGFAPVHGTEIVRELIDGTNVVRAEVHALPFAGKSVDVVSMLDVIEHLLPGDDEAACRELDRVAHRHVLVTANNRPSFNKSGDDLHINKRPYEEWDALFRQWFTGAVTLIKGNRAYVSEAWRVDL
ncbi:MAG: methyltransferase domain-containing protein [Rhizobiales bacterium]|nr:methyltransferase domain-containing protein [Hyphomicrobiales bacterium]